MEEKKTWRTNQKVTRDIGHMCAQNRTQTGTPKRKRGEDAEAQIEMDAEDDAEEFVEEDTEGERKEDIKDVEE